MGTVTSGDNRFVASVDNTHRLLTRTVSKDESIDAILRGDGFAIETTVVNLNTATASAILLYQNDENRDLIAVELGLNFSDSTGSATDAVAVDIATGTDLVMIGGSSNPVITGSLIIGTPSTLDNTSEIGAQGASITGGFSTRSYFKSGITSDDTVFAVFPKGSAIAITVTPPAGNSSMDVNIDITVYLEKSNGR